MNDLSNTRNYSKSWWVALGRHAMIERKEIIFECHFALLKKIYIPTESMFGKYPCTYLCEHFPKAEITPKQR